MANNIEDFQVSNFAASPITRPYERRQSLTMAKNIEDFQGKGYVASPISVRASSVAAISPVRGQLGKYSL
jgi:hypothetical protein